MTATPSSSSAPPTLSHPFGTSPCTSHAVVSPTTGTSMVNGTTAAAGWCARSVFQMPYPTSEASHAV